MGVFSYLMLLKRTAFQESKGSCRKMTVDTKADVFWNGRLSAENLRCLLYVTNSLHREVASVPKEESDFGASGLSCPAWGGVFMEAGGLSLCRQSHGMRLFTESLQHLLFLFFIISSCCQLWFCYISKPKHLHLLKNVYFFKFWERDFCETLPV